MSNIHTSKYDDYIWIHTHTYDLCHNNDNNGKPWYFSLKQLLPLVIRNPVFIGSMAVHPTNPNITWLCVTASCSGNASFDNGPCVHRGPKDSHEAIFIKWLNEHVVEKEKWRNAKTRKWKSYCWSEIFLVNYLLTNKSRIKKIKKANRETSTDILLERILRQCSEGLERRC